MAYGSNIYAVAEDTNGVRWYASRTKGLIVGNRVYMHNPLDSFSLSTNQVFCLLKDHKNRIWVGTFGGGLDLAIPGKDGYRFRHFLTSTYGQRQVRVIFEDDNHWIWVGTSEGVYVFDPDALLKNPKAYYSYTFDNGMLRSNEIRSITSDGKGHILIAESGSGFLSVPFLRRRRFTSICNLNILVQKMDLSTVWYRLSFPTRMERFGLQLNMVFPVLIFRGRHLRIISFLRICWGMSMLRIVDCG